MKKSKEPPPTPPTTPSTAPVGNDQGLTAAEAARVLGISKSMLEKAARTGEIKSFRFGALRRYRRASLEERMRELEQQECERMRNERGAIVLALKQPTDDDPETQS